MERPVRAHGGTICQDVCGFRALGGSLFSRHGVHSARVRQQQVTRIDPDAVTDLSGRWNDTDSRLIANELISRVILRVLHQKR